MRADDFTLRTKRLLAHRVGHLCSNPECNASTSGPGIEHTTLVTVGDAAHITAASPAGPRFNPELTSEQRRSYDNGIWLCVNHARIVDQDDSFYTVDLLRSWKSEAEMRARKDLGRPRVNETHAPAEVVKFIRISRSVLAALRNYGKESTTLGIDGPLAELADVANALGIPVPVAITTIPYPKGVTPHNRFLQDRMEGTCTIRFPDGSEESGKASHASGLELLMEARDSAIVSLEQWIVELGELA